ncbi:MAG: type II toxin-antitoxin system Y4mF family antitoxin [Dermatophilaceae bacterium]
MVEESSQREPDVVGLDRATRVARRKDLRLRQRDLAELAGVSERFVRELEAGKPSVRLDAVDKVLAALGLELVLRVREAGR